MPHDEVARRWNEMSGEKLTRSRVWQIERDARRKLRERLAALFGELA